MCRASSAAGVVVSFAACPSCILLVLDVSADDLGHIGVVFFYFLDQCVLGIVLGGLVGLVRLDVFGLNLLARDQLGLGGGFFGLSRSCVGEQRDDRIEKQRVSAPDGETRRACLFRCVLSLACARPWSVLRTGHAQSSRLTSDRTPLA
jgi:hypothetical protein